MDITSLIGNTPVLRCDVGGRRLVFKLEKYNLTGSAKDRPALSMLLDAKRRGLLRSGEVVEPTSGNTGIALAAIGAAMGLKVTLTMPESMSQERRKMITAYGARLVLSPASEGMNGAIAAAKEIEAAGAFMPMQFENPANPVGQETLGEELFSQCGGKIDAFIATVGSGGTFTGASRVLKRHLPEIMCVAVEPAESAVLSGGSAGAHKIQGIGAGFIPANLDLSLVDKVMTAEGDAAIEQMRRLGSEFGLSVGISSGAAYDAALRLASQLPEGSTVAAVFPDGGDRYLSV